MVVWDATQVLTGLIGQHATRADVLSQLESDASMILVDKMQTYKKTAKTMSVVVLYAKTGAISPTYKVATFEGVERLLTMKASTAAALPKDTPDQVRAGKIPAAITVQLTGQLPPDLQ